MASHFRSTERQGSEGDEQLDVISDVAPQEVATSAEEAVETISESIKGMPPHPILSSYLKSEGSFFSEVVMSGAVSCADKDIRPDMTSIASTMNNLAESVILSNNIIILFFISVQRLAFH